MILVYPLDLIAPITDSEFAKIINAAAGMEVKLTRDLSEAIELSKEADAIAEKAIQFTEDLEVSVENFATINEPDYLFRANVFSRNSFVPNKYKDRKLPLKIERGYKDTDEYIFKIPTNYKFESLPAATELITKFGEYKLKFKQIDETSFSYSRELFIKEGVYPKEDYEEYRNFRKTIAKLENLRIAIIKQ